MKVWVIVAGHGNAGDEYVEAVAASPEAAARLVRALPCPADSRWEEGDPEKDGFDLRRQSATAPGREHYAEFLFTEFEVVP